MNIRHKRRSNKRYFACTMQPDGGLLYIAISSKTDKLKTMSFDISRQLEALFQNLRREPWKILTLFALSLNENEVNRVWKKKCLMKQWPWTMSRKARGEITNKELLCQASWQEVTWKHCTRAKQHGAHCTEIETNNEIDSDSLVDFK